MSLLDVIFRRRSIRHYRSEPIPDDVLRNILEAGRLAPSADNAQPWHFIVVTEPEIKEKLATGMWNRFIKDSAATIVGCGYAADRWSTIDVAIALENLVIAAEAQGVGSCWIGDFKEKEVKKLLDIPDHLKVVALVSFGYPAEKPTPHGKKNLKRLAITTDSRNKRKALTTLNHNQIYDYVPYDSTKTLTHKTILLLHSATRFPC